MSWAGESISYLCVCRLCAISHMMYIPDTARNSYKHCSITYVGLSFMQTGTFEKRQIAQTSVFQVGVKRLAAGRSKHSDHFDFYVVEVHLCTVGSEIRNCGF